MPKKQTAYERMLEWLRPGPKTTTTTTTTPAPTPTTTTTRPPAGGGSGGTDLNRLTLVEWAKRQVGKPYATYRDCSGFTAAAYRQIGITIPEGSVAQWGVGEDANRKYSVGDLIFWDTFGPAPGHVALYIGGGRVIHALNEQAGIVESKLTANMGGPLMGARRIIPRPSPPPGWDPGEPITTVTRDSDFRKLPRITENQVCAILAETPMAAECAAIWRAAKGDPLPLAQSWPESNYGKSENARTTHNPLGLLMRPGWSGGTHTTTANGANITLLDFPTWAEAFREYRYRMDTPDYKGGVYRQGMTLGEYIRTYVAGPGPGYANGESPTSVANYLDATVARINRYLAFPDTTPTTGTTPPPTPQPTGTITFGRVPPPEKYAEKFIAPDGVNTAFNWVNKRIPRGLTLHRMIGTLVGTDNYFRNEAREDALTDFGVGNGGNVYRWTEPGASISPWASGATGVAHAVPSGDGVDFVNRYGWRQNSDTESIEIEGLKYSDPVPAADYQALVQLVAWRVDSWLKIPWSQWPKNHDGAQAIYWHNEFQDEKPCPGQVVMDFTDRLIEDVRVRLRQYQEG